LWDTFRALHPLFNIVQRERNLDFIKTFLEQYKQIGRLPMWELSSNETDCMIGNHAISVIADAYAKGIRGFDVKLAIEACEKTANIPHLGMPEFRKKGYLEVEDEHESVSKTLEYAYNDWCIKQGDTATGVGDGKGSAT
jgi:putative alpha-1,2-mannosidase